MYLCAFVKPFDMACVWLVLHKQNSPHVQAESRVDAVKVKLELQVDFVELSD